MELTGGSSHYGIMQQRQMYQARYGLDFGNQLLANNLANRTLVDLAGLDGSGGLRLAPQSYIAVTETGPEVEQEARPQARPTGQNIGGRDCGQ